MAGTCLNKQNEWRYSRGWRGGGRFGW